MIFGTSSPLQDAAADQRAGMPGRQRQTRRVRVRTPEWGLSTRLLVARQRCSERGTSKRLMVKHSSSPSSRDRAAWIVVFQPAGDLPKLSQALFSLSRQAAASGMPFAIAVRGQPPQDVAQFVVPTALYRRLGSKDGIDGSA